MSFSKQVKEELSKISNLSNKESVKAELIGYLMTVNTSINNNNIKFSTENEYNINRLNKLLNNLNINYNINIKGKIYNILIKKMPEDILNMLLKNEIEVQNNEIMMKSLVRGAFLGGGSVNDPIKNYHLVILFKTEKSAKEIKKIIDKYNITAKIIENKKDYTLYIKDSEEISKFLAFIGSNCGVMEFEQTRVIKDIRNNINRKVNCETANLSKTVLAALEQIEDIKFLIKINKLKELNENLKEIAQLRMKNPELSLVELGKLLKNPIGKSGVNHRLKKISEIANIYRGDK